MSILKISDDLSLPIEAITQKLSFLGRTGSGKSYAATKLCELMLAAKAQVVALDPVGVWYGLRTGGAFSIPVFGGLHGDIPLNESAGEAMADLIAERNLSAVLDISQMVESEQAEFAYDFARQFFQRKKAKPSAVHLFIEECQEFVPQNISGRNSEFTARMLNAFERLIKLGRNFGIGASLISQRPQEVNKKALNQTECLFAFQMTGPQERKAIEAWVGEKGADKSIVEILPKLRVGEPHVWSPQWLGVSKTVRIARKITDDVSSTPRPGVKAATVRELSPVDLDELRKSMAATIEEAKENDPAELHREITRLKHEMEKGRREAVAIQQENQKLREIPGLSEADRRWLKDVLQRIDEDLGKIQEKTDELTKSTTTLLKAREHVAAFANANMQKPVHDFRTRAQMVPVVRPVPKSRTVAPSADGVSISGGLRRMMIALAQRPGMNQRQIGARAVMASKGGSFRTYLSRARVNGWIEGKSDSLRLTAEGLSALGEYTPLPCGPELLQHWLTELGDGSGAARMLQALAHAYPHALPKEQLAMEAGVSMDGGSFRTYLSRMRTLELVEVHKGNVRASAELFD